MSTTAPFALDQGRGAPGASGAGPWRRVPSSREIGDRLQDFIRNGGEGLRNMYDNAGDGPNRGLKMAIRTGEVMATRLITEMECTPGVAKDLSVLTLYDVAILIGIILFDNSVYSLSSFCLPPDE